MVRVCLFLRRLASAIEAVGCGIWCCGPCGLQEEHSVLSPSPHLGSCPVSSCSLPRCPKESVGDSVGLADRLPVICPSSWAETEESCFTRE